MLWKNVKKTIEYMKEKKEINVTKRIFSLLFKEFRDIIYKYLTLVYHTEILGYTNSRGYFAADQSLFSHRANTQIWLLGIIETFTKKFHIEGTLQRNIDTLIKFISKFVKFGNTIIADNWAGYDYLDREDSCYVPIKHNIGRGKFVYSHISTSHIESLWGILKLVIKATYTVIQSKNIMHFIKEAEYKYIIKEKSYDEKIKDFLECFTLLNNVTDTIIPHAEFLSNSNDDSDSDISEDYLLYSYNNKFIW